MNTRVAKIMAMSVAATTLLTPASAYADVVISDETSLSSQQSSGGATVTFDEGKTNDLSNPGGADVSNGPKITVKQDKFLIEKGADFDLKNSLGLSIVDRKEGDITHKFQVSKLDTSKAKSFTKTLTAKTADGKVSTKTLVFRIVDIVDSLDIESVEALQTMDLSKVISGDTDGLTVKLGAIKDGSFIAKVSDGTNTLEKEIKFNVKQGTTGKPNGEETQNPKPEETSKPEDNTTTLGDGSTTPSTGGDTSTSTSSAGDSNPSALPQTGVASATAGVATGLAAISGLLLRKKR